MNSINKSKVVFYLESKDKELLFNHCELLQIRTSFFIRNCILEQLGKPIFNIKPQNLDTKKYGNQLMRIGVNLNQIARKLNSGEANFAIADQRKVLNEIATISNHIIEVQSKL